MYDSILFIDNQIVHIQKVRKSKNISKNRFIWLCSPYTFALITASYFSNIYLYIYIYKYIILNLMY